MDLEVDVEILIFYEGVLWITDTWSLVKILSGRRTRTTVSASISRRFFNAGQILRERGSESRWHVSNLS